MNNFDAKMDSYLEKIKVWHKEFYCYSHPGDWLEKNTNRIKNSIREMLENNYDYLLTDSFLNYIAFGRDQYYKVENLKKDKYALLLAMRYYCYIMADDLIDREFPIYYAFVDLLDKDLRNVIVYAVRRVYKYRDVPGIGDYYFYHLFQIVAIILEYYIINHQEDNICELCDVFLNDVPRTYESLCLNNVHDVHGYSKIEDDKRLIDFVFSKLKAKSKRIIK